MKYIFLYLKIYSYCLCHLFRNILYVTLRGKNKNTLPAPTVAEMNKMIYNTYVWC